jgi:hypothetical protein
MRKQNNIQDNIHYEIIGTEPKMALVLHAFPDFSLVFPFEVFCIPDICPPEKGKSDSENQFRSNL